MRTLDLATQLPGIQSVKLNAVIMKNVNDKEILDFVELTRNRPISVRFIEFMPFSGESRWLYCLSFMSRPVV